MVRFEDGHGLERRGTGKEGPPVRDELSISYSAAIESAAQKDTDEVPSEFGARVEREARRRGFERAARQAVLGDGAKWIWNLASEHFPDAIQIVDRFHAGSDLSKHLVRPRRRRLTASSLVAFVEDVGGL